MRSNISLVEEFGRTIQLAEFPKREKKIVKKNVISMMIDIYYLIRNDRKKLKFLLFYLVNK